MLSLSRWRSRRKQSTLNGAFPSPSSPFKDGVGETADFKEVDILTCQGYVHVIDKVLFYDDAGGSDGALGRAVGVAAGAVALGAALL